MSYIKKVVGRAGTGKTTYMINELQTLFDNGVKPWEIGMVSYSKVAARVFIERALALNESFKARDFNNFGTMHSISAKLSGWNKDINEITPKRYELFMKEYYPEEKEDVLNYDEDIYRLTATDKKRFGASSKYKAMKEIDNLIRSLCLENEPDKYFIMHEMSGKGLDYFMYIPYEKGISKKYGKIELGWRRRQGLITPDEQNIFSNNYNQFKHINDLIDYTDMLQTVNHDELLFNVKYLFVDEFQDFNKLQLNIYQLWRDNPDIEYICIAGDDAQTISRFAGANSQYFISEPSDEHVVLPKTYRHGKVIFSDAQKYLNKMVNVIDCDVIPSDISGEIIKVYGDEWINHLNFDVDESVLVLSGTGDWVNRTRGVLNEKIPDVFFGTLGQKSIEKRVLNHYNIIADLERGEDVEWDRVKTLFTSDKGLPSNMVVEEVTSTLAGIEKKTITKPVLNRVKSSIKSGSFDNYQTYNKKTFAEHFLKVKWSGKTLLNNIKDISYFEAAHDKFPKYCTRAVNKHVGTIHKSKGDEADTVILFMSVNYPMVKASHTIEGKDDILHLFYVGKTRPKTKLIEVYGYHTSGQNVAPPPFDLV